MTVPSTPSYDADPVTVRPIAAAAPRPASTGEAAGEWLERNARAVGGIVIAAAVAVAGTFAWRASSRATAERADRALYQAEAQYAAGDPGAARALQQVTSRYGDTPAGAHARVLLAQAYYDRGQYADGLRVLGAGSVPADWRAAVDRMRAIGDEGAGRPKEAAAIYERLAKDAGPDERATLLADAARAYDAGGDAANARRLWQQVIDSGPAGTAAEARVRLGELEARAR